MATSGQFGAFFRASRKALGLTLREFCRRNGFDSGNVSKLERGLLPPPQTQKVLEAYAGALKLEPGTDRRERFFKLARDSRKPRGTGLRHTNCVKALYLEEWANTLDAREVLPQLVRRLIHATGKGVSGIAFETQRPGWDGIVEAGSVDAFVPAGTSGWEMGVHKDSKGKAEDDFQKRTKNALGLDKKKTSYIFVTPRKWQQKVGWCREKKKLGVWKDVRVYDSASLEEWLERAPAVDAWLAEIMGKRPPGVKTLDDHWANLSSLTNPSLKPEVFLTSRDQEVAAFEEWLKALPAALLIEARSPNEAIDFVAAYICRLSESEKEKWSARAIIIESREAWWSLAGSSDVELLLIAHPSISVEPEMVAEAVRRGHRVLLPSSGTPGIRLASLTLPRAHPHKLEAALESSGLEREAARRYARESGGSLTVLKRLLEQVPTTDRPKWSLPANALSLVPILLAGSWDDDSEGDRLALEKLAGKPYSEVAEIAARWRPGPDSPLTQVMSRWSLLSRDDSWFLLAANLTTDHLRRFEKVALEALGENDPAFDLPPGKRWQANIQNKVTKHSQTLRTGLAETLALLGGRGTDHLDTEVQAGYIVQNLLEGKDWLRWASLSQQLPLLAEAAPDAFLRAVEQDLKRSTPALKKLFEQQGDPFFSTSPHTGLLWALEGLAWERKYLRTVSKILAQLDEQNPNLKSGNHPMTSLQEIFLPWFPQTTAPVEERIRVLKSLMRREPLSGWKLLVNLLPNRHETSMPIHRPHYRDWALKWAEGVTNAEYWQQVVECARLLVENLGSSVERWKELIDQFDNLPEPVQQEFLGRLKAFDIAAIDRTTRQELTDAIRETIGSHRQYSEADWALPSEILTELEEVQRRFEPDDPVARNAWLFGPYWTVRRKFEDKEEEIEARRNAALRQVVGQGEWKGVLQLVGVAEAPDQVGAALAREDFDEYEATIVPDLLVSDDEKVTHFARGYVGARHHKKGWEWINGLNTENWSAEQTAHVLLWLQLPLDRRIWELAAAKGPEVADYFWRRTSAFFLSSDGGEVTFAVSMLLKHKRPAEAFDVLRMAIDHNAALEPSLFLEALAAGIKLEEDALVRKKYDIHHIFQELQKKAKEKDPRVDVARLAGLEFSYLHLLNGHPASPVTLYTMLRDDPKFFVDVLKLIFRPRSEPEESRPKITEKDRALALHGFRLLSDWRTVPGSGEDGQIDEKLLLDWVHKARTLAEEHGLLEVCDSQIGQVLARDKTKEPDGSWPSIPVRDVLEEIGTESDNVFSGFVVGIYNKRGVYMMSPGGDQTRGLAKRFEQYAEACQIDWPQTAAALRQVAQGYERQAQREDAEATLD